MNEPTRKGVPRWMVWWWAIAMSLTAPLTMRLIYEMTYLTWTKGSQAIGFTLAHRHPEILLLGLIGHLGLAPWLIVALFMAAHPGSSFDVFGLAYAASAAASLLVGALVY